MALFPHTDTFCTGLIVIAKGAEQIEQYNRGDTAYMEQPGSGAQKGKYRNQYAAPQNCHQYGKNISAHFPLPLLFSACG